MINSFSKERKKCNNGFIWIIKGKYNFPNISLKPSINLLKSCVIYSAFLKNISKIVFLQKFNNRNIHMTSIMVGCIVQEYKKNSLYFLFFFSGFKPVIKFHYSVLKNQKLIKLKIASFLND